MRKVSLLITLLLSLTVMAQNVYDFTVKDRMGNEVPLSEYSGKVLLIPKQKRLLFLKQINFSKS